MINSEVSTETCRIKFLIYLFMKKIFFENSRVLPQKKRLFQTSITGRLVQRQKSFRITNLLGYIKQITIFWYLLWSSIVVILLTRVGSFKKKATSQKTSFTVHDEFLYWEFLSLGNKSAMIIWKQHICRFFFKLVEISHRKIRPKMSGSIFSSKFYHIKN